MNEPKLHLTGTKPGQGKYRCSIKDCNTPVTIKDDESLMDCKKCCNNTFTGPYKSVTAIFESSYTIEPLILKEIKSENYKSKIPSAAEKKLAEDLIEKYPDFWDRFTKACNNIKPHLIALPPIVLRVIFSKIVEHWLD